MLRSLVALGMIAIFAIYAIGSHYAAMLMYWWFGIFRPHEWMWWDLSSFRLPLVAAILFVIPVVLSKKLPVAKGAIASLILIFGVVTLLGSMLNGCPNPGVWNPATVSTLLFVSLLSARLLVSENGVLGLMAVSGLALSYTAATSGLASTAGGGHLYDVPIGGGAFTGTNAYALGSGIAIFLLASVYQHVRAGIMPAALTRWFPERFVRLGVSMMLLVMIAGSALFVVNTQSRGSALALALGTVVWIFLQRRKFKLLLIAVVLSTLALTVVPLPTGYTDRIADIFDDTKERDKSAASRPHFWETARMMARDNTIGVGVGCFSAYYDAYDTSNGEFGRRRSVHSSHFLVIAEQGYVGAFIWFTLLGVTLLKLWKLRREAFPYLDTNQQAWKRFHICNGLITGLIVFLAGSSFYEFVYNDFTWLIFAMAIGLSRLGPVQKIDDSELNSAEET